MTFDWTLLLTWQWDLFFLLASFLYILPFLGWLLNWIVVIYALWGVLNAAGQIYRETNAQKGAVTALFWSTSCLIWPLTIAYWYWQYGDARESYEFPEPPIVLHQTWSGRPPEPPYVDPLAERPVQKSYRPKSDIEIVEEPWKTLGA